MSDNEIWEVTINNLKKDVDSVSKLASEFMSETKFLNINIDTFLETWETLLGTGSGSIFILDDFHGALGAVTYNDPNDGKLVATEMFWIVAKEYRGYGHLLLKHYENWAKEKGCARVIMVHMVDSMPDVVKTIYINAGYKEMETSYIKDL